MKNILIDENGDYGLEYTNAVWASDQMHQDYHTAKVPLADADFLLEDEKFMMIVEYKNANTRKARDAGFKTTQFNPMDDPAKDEERIEVLEKMVLRFYEDMVAGRITEENFNLLLEKTQKEQAELKAKVEEGRKRLADEIRLAVDARQWVESIQEYRDITELDASTLNRLMKEIVVHETIDSDKTRHISIEIHFNLKPIPEVEQVTD